VHASTRGRSKTLSHVEQAFGFQESVMGGKSIRTIDTARAAVKTELMNVIHNVARFTEPQHERKFVPIDHSSRGEASFSGFPCADAPLWKVVQFH
jgi:hypothetical protein